MIPQKGLAGGWQGFLQVLRSLSGASEEAGKSLEHPERGRERASENDDRLGAQLHPEAFLHAVLDAAGQMEDVLAGGLTVVDQHQGMAG